MDLYEVAKKQRGMLKVSIESEALGKVEADLYDELLVKPGDELREHVDTAAARMAYWGTLYEIAKQELDELQREWDLWYAKRYELVFKLLWAKGGNKSTSKPNINTVENQVMIRFEKEYRERMEELSRAKHRVSLLKSVLSWWDAKIQMLIQASKLTLAEWRGIGLPRLIDEAQEQELDE